MRKTNNIGLAGRIFTSKSRVKILGLFFFKKNIFGIREISRELNVPVSAIQREVENLLDIGLIKKENGKITLNHSCSFLNDIGNILVKTDYVFFPIKNILTDDKIDFAFIFGSFAKGDIKESSDIDLMIIGDVSESDIFKKLTHIEKEVGREINSIIWTKKEIISKKNTAFVKDLMKKIIMIKGDENELRKFAE